MRINRYIANSGICSRRGADELVLSGKVKINGKTVLKLGTMVNEDRDLVEVDSNKISIVSRKVYILLNKPEGYVTTSKEQFNRPSVLDLVDLNMRVFPVGRLDMYTSGLLILTNDGEFANKLTHPKNKVTKTYYVKVKGDITDDIVKNISLGVDIGDYVTKEAKVRKLSKDEIEILISEGKNRQVRKMCESQNLKVLKLVRMKIGGLEIGNLKAGEYRLLNKKDINKIFKLV